MAQPVIPKALYPLVPNAPGVPILLRSGAVIVDTLTGGLLGLTNAFDNFFGTSPVLWGVFAEDGQPVAIADSVISMGYQNNSRLSDYPMEEGAFGTYNKVANPYSVRLRMTRGGTEQERSDFIAALEDAASSLDLFTVLTPEVTYDDANIEGFEYLRETKGGAYMITADIYLREIRNTVTTAFNIPKSTDAASPQSGGQVQTFPVTQSVITAVALGPLR